MNRAQRKINRQFRQFNRRLDQQARRAVRAATIAVAGITVAATREFVQLERAQLRLFTLVGKTTEEFEAQADTLRNIGIRTGTGPVAIINTLEKIESGGVLGADALRVLEASAKAAAIELGDAATIGRLASQVYDVYGKNVEVAVRALDELAAGVRLGNIASEELSANIGRTLPFARELSVAFGELTGVYAALSRQGNTAAIISTQLENTMRQLRLPTDQARKNLEGLYGSLANIEALIEEQGLTRFLVDLVARLDEAGLALNKVLTSEQAQAFVVGLVGDRETANASLRIIDEVIASSGALDEAFAKIQGSALLFTRQLAALGQTLLASLGRRIVGAIRERFGSMEEALESLERAGERLADGIVIVVDGLTTFAEWVFRNRDAIGDFAKALIALRLGALGVSLANTLKSVGVLLAGMVASLTAASRSTVLLTARMGALSAVVAGTALSVGSLFNAIRQYRIESDKLKESLAERDRVRARLNERLQETREQLERGIAGETTGLNVVQMEQMAGFVASIRDNTVGAGDAMKAFGEEVKTVARELEELGEISVNIAPSGLRQQIDRDRFLESGVSIGDLNRGDRERLSAANQLPEIEVTARQIGQQIADGISKQSSLFTDLGQRLQGTLARNLSYAFARGDWSSIGQILFQSVTEALIQPFLERGIQSLFGGLFGGLFHTGAERGPIRGPNREVGIIAERDEWVLTPSQIQNLARGGGEGRAGINATFIGDIDHNVRRSFRRLIGEFAPAVNAFNREHRIA